MALLEAYSITKNSTYLYVTIILPGESTVILTGVQGSCSVASARCAVSVGHDLLRLEAGRHLVGQRAHTEGHRIERGASDRQRDALYVDRRRRLLGLRGEGLRLLDRDDDQRADLRGGRSHGHERRRHLVEVHLQQRPHGRRRSVHTHTHTPRRVAHAPWHTATALYQATKNATYLQQAKQYASFMLSSESECTSAYGCILSDGNNTQCQGDVRARITTHADSTK